MLKLSLGLSRHRVLVTRCVEQDVLEKLDRFFEVEHYQHARPLTRDELLARLKEKAGVLATGNDTIDAEMIAQLRSLKAVCTMAVSCENLDMHALTQAGIMVTNAPADGGGDTAHAKALRAADNLIAAFGFGRIGGKPANLLNPELLCDCC